MELRRQFLWARLSPFFTPALALALGACSQSPILPDHLQDHLTAETEPATRQLARVEVKNACGLRGTVASRIQDCRNEYDAELGDFSLVYKNGQDRIYANDQRTLLWSSRVFREKRFTFDEARKVCANYWTVVTQPGLPATWRLPTREEFRVAVAQGLPGLPGYEGNQNAWSAEPHTQLEGWNLQLPSGGSVPHQKKLKYPVFCVSSL